MSTEVSADWLEGVAPLRELDRGKLEVLAAEAEIETYPPRTLIFRRGERDGWTRYVLSGEVVLVEAPGESGRSVVGLGDAGVAEEPLGMGDTHTLNALARTEVRLIRLATARIEELLAAADQPPEYEVGELGGTDESEQLYTGLISDLLQDRLSLPSMPDIAVKVRSAVADSEVGAPEVARIIQADPAVAAKVLQVANSALYGGQNTVDSLNVAVVRLGLRNVREIVTAVTMREVFRCPNPLLNKRMVELWMHSTLVAATAAVLARRLGGFDSDRALLAGLVHDIGVVPMLAHAANYAGLANDPQRLESAIAAHRADVGSMILRRWNFSDEMIDVVLAAEQWSRDHDGPADYADLIVAAQLQCLAGSAESEGLPALAELPVFGRLGLDRLGAGSEEALLEEARGEIAEVQRLLMG